MSHLPDDDGPGAGQLSGALADAARWKQIQAETERRARELGGLWEDEQTTPPAKKDSGMLPPTR